MSAVTRELGREELAALVCSALEREGIEVVLSGGGAAAIYARNPYESMDLDFIRTGLTRKVDATMTGLGFSKKDRHWVHPSSAFWIEFLPGPVQIGDAVVHDFAKRETAYGTLRILTPTASVMDRLAWHFHAQDESGLEQAVAITAANEVDLGVIEAWSKNERAEEKFERFRTLLRKKTTPN